MRDPYQVLGVPKTASAAEIKKAYRKLAKQYHPDQNKDPKAAARFAEINSAHEIVGDEKKRGQFDRGEIDAEGKPRFHGFENAAGGFEGAPGGGFEFNFGGGRGRRAGGFGGAGGGGFEDILSEMFGGGTRGGGSREAPRGGDLQGTVRAPFVTWALGGTARVTLAPGRTVDVKIPAGIAAGKTIRLRGQGETSPFGGEPGDALITIEIEPHPLFRAEGRNVRVDVNVTVYEAALGGKVRVPTLDGSVDLTLPPGTSGTRVFRLKGKGIQAKDGAGDLLVTPRIVLPPTISSDFEAAMKRLRDEHPYDPGR